MDVNRAIDDFIDNLEPLEPSPPRSEVPYHKSLSESEEDLDRPLQVRGGLANVYRRAPVSVDYSDFNDDASPLSSCHQGLRAPSTWSGGLGYRKGMESSKLPDLSPPSCAINLVGWARVSEGHNVLQATRPQPTFLRHHIGRVGSGIGRARSPPSYPTSAHLPVPSAWSGGLEHRKGTESSKLPDLSPTFCAINPDELPFQEGRPLDSFNEEEGWIAKSSSPDQEIFMAFIEEIPFKEAEGSDRVQLDNFYLDDDDYISNTPTTPNRDTRSHPNSLSTPLTPRRRKTRTACEMNAVGL
jgi:hypothetical protein